jgi:predicted DNA-binding transcriptional regulator AlpA
VSLLTVEETARRLGISPKTIYNRISRKAEKPFPIRFKRFMGKPLFYNRDVEAFIHGLEYQDALDEVSNEKG